MLAEAPDTDKRGICDCLREPPIEDATVCPPAEGVGDSARCISEEACPASGLPERKKRVSRLSSPSAGADARGFRIFAPPIDCRPFEGLAPGAGILEFGEVGLSRCACELLEVVEKAGEAGRAAKGGTGAVKLRDAGRAYPVGSDGVNLPLCT